MRQEPEGPKSPKMRDVFEPDLVGKGNLPQEIESLSRDIIGCALEVHRHLGPGLLERIYEQALVHELRLRGIQVRSQVDIVVRYKGLELHGQRLDLLVGEAIVVELKSAAALADAHTAVLLSYLRSTNLPLGLLMNFNVPQLRQGLKRVFNERAPVVIDQRPKVVSPPTVSPSGPS